MKGNKSQKIAILDQAAESLDEATECLDEYTGRLDNTAVLIDGGTDLTDKGARILDSATESLDYASRGMPRRAGFTHGNFGFGVRFLLDDAVSFDLLPMSIYERSGLGLQQRPFIPSADLLDNRPSIPSQDSDQTWKIIWQGAWPDVLNKEARDREWFFQSMLDFYIGKDIMVLNGIQNRLQFMKFMKALALCSGKELSMSSLGEIAEISQPTVRRWLSIAEASGLIYLIRPYYANIKKQLVKTPKVIMADTGLIAFLLGLKSPEEMASHMNSGAFFETVCIMEILKSWVHNGEFPDFYYYRDSQGIEVDLLIKHNGTYWPVEIKSAEAPGRKHSKWVERFQEISSNAGIPVGLGSVIGMTPTVYPITDNVIAYSIWAI